MSELKATPSPRDLKSVNNLMRDTLGGHVINQMDGPNDSLLEFWVINGSIVIVQIWSDNNGWEYFLQGRQNKLDSIPDDINQYLAPSPRFNPTVN